MLQSNEKIIINVKENEIEDLIKKLKEKLKVEDSEKNKIINNLKEYFNKIEKENKYFFKIVGCGEKTDSDYCVQFNNYVGSIWFNQIQINIFPKIFDNIESTDANEKLIISMKYWWRIYLEYKNKNKNRIFFLNYSLSGKTFKKRKKSELFDWFLWDYVEKVSQIFKNQIYHEYVYKNENSSFIKGKINFNDFVKNKIPKGNFFNFNCSFFEYSHKNLFNGIIKKCLKIILQKFLKTDEYSNEIQKLLSYLNDVEDSGISEQDCDFVNLYNVPTEFHNILKMSKIILHNSYIDKYGNLIGYLFLLKMSSIFEIFVKNQLENAGILIEQLDNEDNKLTWNGEFKIRPDIVVKNKVVKNKTIVADCKYKRIKDIEEKNNDIVIEDIYQLIVYSNILRSKNSFLIYPLSEEELDKQPYELKVKDSQETKITILKINFICNLETKEPKSNSSFINKIKQNLSI